MIKHNFTSGIADGGDATLVRPSNWNDFHVETYAPGSFTLATGTYAVVALQLSLVSTDTATLAGTSCLRII